MKFEFYSQLFEPDRLYIPEQRLQKCWSRSLWKKPFQTINGDPVQVISPGIWNRHEGPDFLDALLFIADSMREGDIEIHYNNGDWYRHGHHRDPAYDRVVLHVIFSRIDHERSVVNSRGEHIPVTLMDYEVLNDLPFESVCRPSWKNQEQFFNRLKESGFKRLNLKVDYIRRRHTRFSYDLLAWWGLFQSCGLKANRSSFNRLFLSFPWEDYFSGRIRKEDISPLLEYLAGFKTETFCREKYSHIGAPHDLRWVHVGVRPASHPENRLKWLAAYLMKNQGKSLINDLTDHLSSNGFSRRFWRRFLVSGCPDCREPGEDLSVELAMNALVPVILASIKAGSDEYVQILKGVERLSVAEYRLSRRFYTRHEMNIQNYLRRKWVIQQGILYIHERFCTQNLADLCPLCKEEEGQ